MVFRDMIRLRTSKDIFFSFGLKVESEVGLIILVSETLKHFGPLISSVLRANEMSLRLLYYNNCNTMKIYRQLNFSTREEFCSHSIVHDCCN